MLRPIRSLLAPVRIACLAFLPMSPAAFGQPPPRIVEPRKVKQPDIGAIVSMKHEISPYGKTNDGQEVKVHSLMNLHGMRVRLIDYGATLIGVETPDRAGKNANITLGFPSLDGYLQRHP